MEENQINQVNEVNEINQVSQGELPVQFGFWNKFKTLMLKEIKVELTPYQQKVEDEINEFLHKEITWQGVKGFLFQEIRF